MRTFLASALSIGLAAFAAAGPVGPPSGSPILDSNRVQNVQANISSLTVRDLLTGTTMVAYVLNLYGTGANQYSLILSSGMHVLAGGVTAPFFYGDGRNLTNISASSVASSGVGFGAFQNGAYSFPNAVSFPYGVWTASGNVGINTTNPGFALDVNGSANFSGILVGPTISAITASTQATAALLATFGISTNTLAQATVALAASTTTLQAQIYSTGAATATLRADMYAVGAATAAHQAQLAAVAVATTSNQNQIYAVGAATAAIEVQVITLGTSTNSLQSQLLQVGASTASLYNLAGVLGMSTNTLRGIIDAMGISTNSLQAQFVLVGASTSTLRILADALGISTNSLQVQSYAVGAATATLQLSKVNRSGDAMTGSLTMAGGSTVTITGNEFSVGGSIFYVKSNGYVGIGTTNPDSPLGFTPSLYLKGAFPSLVLDSTGGHRYEIGSNSPAGLNIYDVTAGVLRAVITGGGNFGIATAAPDATLHVGGQIHADTNVTASSGSFTAAGANAYSLNLSSGINAPAGTFIAGMFVGDGSRLTNITGATTDPAIGQSTAALRALADALGISTNSLQSQLYSVGRSTAALQVSTTAIMAVVDALGLSTANLNAIKLSLAGGTMVGQITMSNAPLVFTGTGGYITAISSVNGGSFFGDGSHLTAIPNTGNTINLTGSITASSGTFTQSGNTSYSLALSSGINMPAGTVNAKVLIGDGSRITGLPSSSLNISSQTFLTSGTWTKPAGVTRIAVCLVGGGGGGASGDGGGGGGGAVKQQVLTVTSDVTVTIGAGGVGTISAQTAGSASTLTGGASMTSGGGAYGSGSTPGTGNAPSDGGGGGGGSGSGAGPSSGGGGGSDGPGGDALGDFTVAGGNNGTGINGGDGGRGSASVTGTKGGNGGIGARCAWSDSKTPLGAGGGGTCGGVGCVNGTSFGGGNGRLAAAGDAAPANSGGGGGAGDGGGNAGGAGGSGMGIIFWVQ